ncbi:MAG: hypothetical protein NZT61_05700 [Deltaproteobacteria bacterium]|nr:hypothetical protein [Deltaproteobacteria bacterium]
MYPEFQHDIKRQRLSEQFRQIISGLSDLDENSRHLALARSEEFANLLAGFGSAVSPNFFVEEISEEEFRRLFLTEAFETTYQFLTLLKQSFSPDRKLDYELQYWILVSKDDQEFYLSNLEKVFSVLPEKSHSNGVTLIAITLCGLEAHRLNRELVEQIFAFLRDNPELAPVISEAVAFSYYDVVNPRLAAPRSLYLGYLSFVFNLILDLSSKAIDSRLLEALIHSQDYWSLLDKVIVPESKSEQELMRQTLAEILLTHESIFTSTPELVELFPDFLASLILNPLFVAKPECVKDILNKAVEILVLGYQWKN